MSKVLTLNAEKFADACHRLADLVKADGFAPDVIIGVRTGGDRVGRIVAASFPDACYSTVTAFRPGTEGKRRSGRLLARLPYVVTDRLREIESFLLSRSSSGDSARNVTLEVDGKSEELMNKSGCKVLIIDDAIDSGATLRQVKGKLQSVYPMCCCKAAVLTVTVCSPVERPEYWLFNNKLIRFPWSTDFRT